MSPASPKTSPPSGADHRGSARRDVLVPAKLLCGELWAACEVVNVSVGGARLRVECGDYAPGQELCLEIEFCGRLPGKAVWVRGDELGLTFSCDPAVTAEALIALATYG